MSQMKSLPHKSLKLPGFNPTGFALATFVSGVWWYYTRRCIDEFSAQQQKVIERVDTQEQAINFKKGYDYTEPNNWEGKKASLDGFLHGGRFMVKKNRGGQEGYIVLAPFVVTAQFSSLYQQDAESTRKTIFCRKFILNMGWIPRSKKYMISKAFPYNAIGQETYNMEDREEALKKQEADGLIRDPLKENLLYPITNVSVVLRKGQTQDEAHGYKNFKEQLLYKYIDLPLVSKGFRINNEKESESIYLQRVAKSEDEEDILPIPSSKNIIIQDLQKKSKEHQENMNKSFGFVTGLSFLGASAMTFL